MAKEVRDLIRRMSIASPLWGSPRILGELRKIGIAVAKSTVEKYIVRPRKPSSPTWKAFPKNHLADTIAIDFFVVPTVRLHVLYVFLVLAHQRRRVLYFNVTTNPSAECTAQQIVETFPWDGTPRYLLRARWDLRRTLPKAGEEHGHRGSRHCSPEPMAESLLRATHR